jgi:hypothetical protein
MDRRHILRIVPFIVGIAGSMAPDIGHGLNLVTKGKVQWDLFHGNDTYFVLSIVVCSLVGGLTAILVLMQIRNKKEVK